MKPKADPIVAILNNATNHKKSSKKKLEKKKQIMSSADKKSFDIVIAECLKRYKKWGYTGYLGHAENMRDWVENL